MLRFNNNIIKAEKDKIKESRQESSLCARAFPQLKMRTSWVCDRREAIISISMYHLNTYNS